MNRSVQKIRRYAKSLLDVALQEDGVEAVRSDLDQVRRWLDEAPAFHVFAASDRFGGREVRMRAVLELVRAAGLGRLAAEFLARIEAAQEMGHLGLILDEFERLRCERAGIVHAEIVSARPLTDGQKAELVRRFGGQPGPGRMEISYQEDPGLLGGFVARIGEQVHDYSVSGRLARLRRRLVDA